ncbi:1,4-beta-xylanase [Pedobacter sp. HMWF019]|uniref:cellulase family glycosylhydrolase n=1 Tax=Pedobacter sp. HMWF019 TaxID=2056856 RepID=UPI000D347F85|nr:cellulase family glycosylhydrolase [Pedobacter sp. HMWF019]PTT00447.1 1,4-beta-xylanase [Pedobacter sp. HMWF019]
MKRYNLMLLLLSVIFFQACTQKQVKTTAAEEPKVWTSAQAKKWYNGEPWLIGSNYLPSTAINQLEMWQQDTFDTTTINRELGWAQSLGMNTMRVYLHDLPYQDDSTGFLNRIDIFLRIAKAHNIKPMFVIFDSCWDPFPKSGKQRAPKPFVHNSGWVQSPGREALKDTTQYARLEKYVKGLVGHFAQDSRILAWDVWNEPDNTNDSSYGKEELPQKAEHVIPLLKKTFEWARSARPSQPLTSAVWAGDWSSDTVLKPIQKLQLEESDVISFHNYDKPVDFENRIKQLERYNKPMICTEYMARPNGSTFEGFLPIAKKYHVGMINWGFVDGKSQTIYPWDSWQKKYTGEPPVWFHDIFRKEGTPYRAEETNFIKQMTGVTKT